MDNAVSQVVPLNYLLNNPVKHNYLINLADYPNSSFHATLEKLGRDTLAQQFKDYPEYKDLQLDEDY